MHRSEKESVSVWQQDMHPTPIFPLRKKITTDVCVIGAGIAGLSAGFHLQKEGKDVVIVDAWGLASGETSRTTAHLTSVPDDGFEELEKIFGLENALLALASHKA